MIKYEKSLTDYDNHDIFYVKVYKKDNGIEYDTFREATIHLK